jgi:hypothetical protein
LILLLVLQSIPRFNFFSISMIHFDWPMKKKKRFWDFGHSYWEYLWERIWNLGNILQNTLEWQLRWPIIKGSSEIVDTTIGNILRNSFGTWGNVLWTHWVLKATWLEHIGNIKNQKNSNPLAAPSPLTEEQWSYWLCSLIGCLGFMFTNCTHQPILLTLNHKPGGYHRKKNLK